MNLHQEEATCLKGTGNTILKQVHSGQCCLMLLSQYIQACSTSHLARQPDQTRKTYFAHNLKSVFSNSCCYYKTWTHIFFDCSPVTFGLVLSCRVLFEASRRCLEKFLLMQHWLCSSKRGVPRGHLLKLLIFLCCHVGQLRRWNTVMGMSVSCTEVTCTWQ